MIGGCCYKSQVSVRVVQDNYMVDKHLSTDSFMAFYTNLMMSEIGEYVCILLRVLNIDEDSKCSPVNLYYHLICEF